MLKNYQGVYLSAVKEGGYVLELSASGQLDLYEMWYSKQQQSYVLVLTQSYPLLVGSHDGKLAFLGGEYHLLEVVSDGVLQLHNIMYRQQNAPLTVLGKVVSAHDVN